MSEKEDISNKEPKHSPSGSDQTTKHNNEKPPPNTDLPAIQQLTVEELYDKDKYDLSTMEPGDVFVLLQ